MMRRQYSWKHFALLVLWCLLLSAIDQRLPEVWDVVLFPLAFAGGYRIGGLRDGN